MATAGDVLGDIRIPHAHIDALINDTLVSLNDPELGQRVSTDRAFHVRITDMTQNIVIATTLAQTLAPDQPFAQMMAGVSFSGQEADLFRVGHAMLTKIQALLRLPDPAISDAMLKTRFEALFAAL